MTWEAIEQACIKELRANNIENPETLVNHWFQDVFGRLRPRSQALKQEQILLVNKQLQALIEKKPLAYISNISHFYGLRLFVQEGVLVPRPETEELVRWILENHPEPELKFADYCTGSGCIALALCMQRKSWQAYAFDVSEIAIETVNRNAQTLTLNDRLSAVKLDLLKQQPTLEFPLDILVSNPPYIPSTDWSRVASDVAKWEPEIALMVADNEPLLFYKMLVQHARQILKPKAWLYVECNDLYAKEVADYFRVNYLQQVEVFTDMQGKARHVRAQMN